MKQDKKTEGKIYYVEMNAVGRAVVAVLAKNKKEALKLADKHSCVVTCHCDGFEANEVLKDYPWADKELIESEVDSEYPVLEV